MKRSLIFALTLAVLATFSLSGCSDLGNSEGPALFAGETTEVVDGTDPDEGTSLIAEFGYLVEGTQCVKQIHSGCVPYDYARFFSDVFGLPFKHPTDWSTVGSDDTEIVLIPNDRADDTDPTRLFAWRQVAVDSSYDIVKSEIVDAGEAMIGPYDVTWEIYEGEWEGVPVTAEWVTLTHDAHNPWVNYTFFLITESENFLADQNVIKAAASSVLEE